MFCTQHGNKYKAPLVINTIDLTEEAKPRFESKLKGLVGVDDLSTELKYKPCDDAPPDTPPGSPPRPQSPLAVADEGGGVDGGVVDGGVVIFGDAQPLPHSEGGSDAPARGSDPAQGAGGEKRALSGTDDPNQKPAKVCSPAHRRNAAAHQPRPALS